MAATPFTTHSAYLAVQPSTSSFSKPVASPGTPRDHRRGRWSDRRTALVSTTLVSILLTGSFLAITLPPADRVGSSSALAASSGIASVDSLFDAMGTWSDLGTLRQLLGPAASLILSRESGPAPSQPRSVHEALLALDGPRWEPLPLPVPDDGPDPLLGALHVLSAKSGTDLPSEATLRADLARLRLQPPAERALAVVVLAYAQALELEAHAVRDLSDEERRFVDREPFAVAAWLKADPERGVEDIAPAIDEITRSRVDLGDRVRAADMLLRAIEASRTDLGLPQAPYKAPSVDVEAPTETESAWLFAQAVMRLPSPVDGLRLPDVPQEPLSVAVRKLAWVLGHPPLGADVPELDLPPSLANAIASIVTARRIGIETGNPAVHSLLLMETTRKVEPTLRAWAAVIDANVAIRDRIGQRADGLPAVISESLRGDASPTELVAAGKGLQLGSPATSPSLEAILLNLGYDATTAAAAAASLPEPVADAAAQLVHASNALEAVRAKGNQVPGSNMIFAVEEVPSIAGLLGLSSWNSDQAGLVASWAEGLSASEDAGALASLEEAQAMLLQAAESAAGSLSVEFGDVAPQPGATASASSAGPAGCPRDSPLSVCDLDVWLQVPGGVLLVTGFGETTVDGTFGSPRLIIDLGGSDTYLIAAGGGAPGSPSVVIEVEGADVYRSSQRVVHGAADGLGAVGILWDIGGDDTYEQTGTDASARFAQGAGGPGALGVLVDEAGSDTYLAPDADAHGSGWGATPIGGSGILVDRAGTDLFSADRGQGYASGQGSLGVLVHEDGLGTYQTTKGNVRYQGGVASGFVALGLLVDLGGAGTQYSNAALAEEATLHAHADHARERGDDVFWFERSTPFSLGLGIDSTMDDDDQDRFPNLIELAARSDPNDASPAGQPGLGSVNGAIETITGLVGEVPGLDDILDPTSLLEGAGFSDRLLCRNDSNPCDEPMSVLQVNGTRDDDITATAHVLIELGGNDVYLTEVAGPGHFYLDGQAWQGLGSYALDVGGRDHYATPDLDWTQGSVQAFDGSMLAGQPPVPTTQVPSNCLTALLLQRLITPECDVYVATQQAWANNFATWANVQSTSIVRPENIPPVSLLINVEGDDVYEARSFSQGAAASGESICPVAGSQARSTGAAWLIDLAGADTYHADAQSQAAAFGDGGVGGMVDVLGNDEYRFTTQASADQDGPGFCFERAAVFVDGGGVDLYNSTTIRVDTVGLTRGLGDRVASHDVIRNSETDEAFATQGTTPGAVGSTANGQGFALFGDHGEEIDRYVTINLTDQFVDVSSVKNDVTRVPNKNAGVYTDGAAWFADLAAAQDPDVDGAPSFFERLAAADPRDDDNNLGAVWQAPARAAGVAADPNIDDPEDVARVVGLDESAFWFRWPGILGIGNRADKQIDESFGLMVSLGGNNEYTGPNLAGALTSTVVALVDVGDGDTRYAPQTDACRQKAPGAAIISVCPSLGGAVDGIAILADGGGENRFETRAEVVMLDQGQRTYEILTQGASIQNAVGILVTWNATKNVFDANLDVNVGQLPGGAVLTLTLQGTSQGASRAGIGLLASLGDGDDTYSVGIQSTYPATDRSLSQGAAHVVVTVPTNPNQVRNTKLFGAGLLLDGGGTNTFTAPDGFAQGYGENALGILWAGPGPDTLLSNSYGQGAARGTGIGVLYDSGGSDSYEAARGTVAAHVVQGAADGTGTGVLIDLSGDERYFASEFEFAQAAGMGGTGILVDLGGHDEYRALGRSQAYFSDPVGAAVLFDVQGNDVYEVETGLGQGAGTCPAPAPSSVPSPPGRGSLFVDAQGVDSYYYAHQKPPLGDPADADGNNGVWNQGACAFSVGLDAEQLDQALETIRSIPLSVGMQDIAFSAWSGLTRLDDGAVTKGEVRLEAIVRVEPPDPALVDRVAFVSNRGLIGHGDFAGEHPTGLRYELRWQTDAGRFPDRTYTLRASAFLQPAGGVPSLDSAPFDLVINNPPLLKAFLDTDEPRLAPSSDAVINMGIVIGPDLAAQEPPPADERCAAGSKPGGQLTIGLHSQKREYIVFSAYCNAGELEIELNGKDAQGRAMKDGTYEIVVALRDSLGQATVVKQPDLPLLTIDGQAPQARIPVNGYANRQLRGAGGLSLALPWTATDFDGAGVDKACLFQVNAQGERVEEPLAEACFDRPGQSPPPLQVPGVETGMELRFVAVASDRLGNVESPCLQHLNEQPDDLCYRQKSADEANVAHFVVDFDDPLVASPLASGVEPERTFLRPGSFVNFTVEATDVGSGLAQMDVELPGIDPIQMDTDGQGLFWFDRWHLTNAALHEDRLREEAVTFGLTARDRAENVRTEAFSITLDSLAPRLAALETRYQEPGSGGGRLAGGRAGAAAVVSVLAEEAGLKGLSVDASLVATNARVDCVVVSSAGPVSAWECPMTLRPDVPDGDYLLPVLAVDEAGNENGSMRAQVLVRGAPLHLESIELVTVTHESIQVSWSTGYPGTSVVEWGRTATLGQVATSGDNFATEHLVTVTGLEPSTQYFYRVLTQNEGGVISRSAVFPVTTPNAYRVEFMIPDDLAVGGTHPFAYTVTIVEGNEALNIGAKLRDVGRATSPIDLDAFAASAGAGVIEINTTTFADGVYRLQFVVERVGDDGTFESPAFTIDNTPPVVLVESPPLGALTADARPLLIVAIHDPLATQAMPATSLTASIGDEVLELAIVAVEEPVSTVRRLTVRPVADLPEGKHDIVLSAVDEAGNVGNATWRVIVDASAPTIDQGLVPQQSVRARPGGYLHVEANVTDGAGVASVSVDLAPVGSTPIPLKGNGRAWSGDVPLPQDIKDGAYTLLVNATDSLGNKGLLSTITVDIDGTRPRFMHVSLTDASYTRATVAVEADEPILLWQVGHAEPARNESSPWTTRATLSLIGLRSGSDNVLSLHMADQAGNVATRTVTVSTLEDLEPPRFTEGNLSAVSDDEGIVELRWPMATDNGEVEYFLVERAEAPRSPAFADKVAPDVFSFVDEGAPAGRNTAYRVSPVDRAGLKGIALDTVVRVLAFPHLANASVTPLRGSHEDPFTFQVEYKHAGGQSPDYVRVAVGNQSYELAKANEVPCHRGCLYEAKVPLPLSSVRAPAPSIVFHAAFDDQEVTLAFSKSPFVTDSRSADVPGASSVPALLGVIVVVFAALSARSGRRRL